MFNHSRQGVIKLLSATKVFQEKILFRNGIIGTFQKLSALKNAPEKDVKNDLYTITTRNKNSLTLLTTKTHYQKNDYVNGIHPGHMHMVLTDHRGEVLFTLSKRPNTSKRLKSLQAAKDSRFSQNEVGIYEPLFTDHPYEVQKWAESDRPDVFIHVIPVETFGSFAKYLMEAMQSVVNSKIPYQLISAVNESNQIRSPDNCIKACFEVLGQDAEDVDFYCDQTTQVATVTLLKSYVKDGDEYQKQVKNFKLITSCGLDQATTRPALKDSEKSYSLVI